MASENSVNTHISPHHVHGGHSDSCGHKKEKSRFDRILHIIEKTCAVALGIFSAYLDFKLFAPFFIAGMAIEIYRLRQSGNSCNHRHLGSACAHGLIEQLTGVKLPAAISLAANIAVTVCHIDHHADVFIPIIGISLGAWAGKLATQYGTLAYRKIAVCLASKIKFKQALIF